LIKRIITAGVLALAIASNFINEEVYAEPQYNVGLEIETLDVPINWVNPGQEVQIRVKINNNPGFTYLSFLVKRDENTHEYISAITNRNMVPYTVVTSYFLDDFSYAVVSTNQGSYGPYYDLDDTVCYLELILPETINVGDFYGVEFVPEYRVNEEEIGFYKDRVFYGQENITEYINGGIRIVEEKPLYGYVGGETEAPQPEVTETPAEQPPATQQTQPSVQPENTQPSVSEEVDNSSDSESSNETSQTTENIQQQTEITTTESASITSETTTVEKSISTTKTTLTDKTETVILKAEETTSTQEEIDEAPEKTKNSSGLLPILVSLGILLSGGVIFAVLQKKNKKGF